MFEKELKLAAEKVQQLRRKLDRLTKEREGSEAATLELTVDLVEQHAIGENIGIVRWSFVQNSGCRKAIYCSNYRYSC